MRRKVLYMDWLDKFSCVGGSCPLTCCSSMWKIELKEKEIADYEKLDHPFRDELIGAIDKENKCMKTRGKVCAMLTEDGWCRLVRACGEDKLSNTCTSFPRCFALYGDILEATVEILCPVVAGYLLDREEINFGLAEEETNEEETEIDYPLYDNLSFVRTYLIDMISQSYGRFASGKVYLIFSILHKMEELWKENVFCRAEIIKRLEVYDKPEVRQDIFQQCETLSRQADVKGVLLQNLLIQLRPIIVGGILQDLFIKDTMLQENLEIWASNAKVLIEDVKNFSNFIREEYPMVMDKFLIYVLFLNWITLDMNSFGHTLHARMIEWTLIQIFAMSLWKQRKGLEKEAYKMLICYVDRMMSHNQGFYDNLYQTVKELGKDNVANIMMLVI